MSPPLLSEDLPELDLWLIEEEAIELILTHVPEASELPFEEALDLAIERNEQSALRLEKACLAAMQEA